MKINPFAGESAAPWMLTNIPGLVAAYCTGIPDTENPEEKVVFGTSGHRGTSLKNTFNEWHILAICQAICMFRAAQQTDGPLFIGMDTHALSIPAFSTALEVLAANGVQVMISKDDEFTPTPAVSHAILKYNKDRTSGFADGIIITPSHNPPGDGGFKYNPPNGGPAPSVVTTWIEDKANEILSAKLRDVKAISLAKALHISSTQRYDYLNNYVDDLHNVINVEAISSSGLRIGIDALGGAGMHYWEPIAKRYVLDLTVFNKYISAFIFEYASCQYVIRMVCFGKYTIATIQNTLLRFPYTRWHLIFSFPANWMYLQLVSMSLSPGYSCCKFRVGPVPTLY